MVSVNIRSLQHFLYCPHQWWLIETERVWDNNAFVAKGNVVHERVHDGSHRVTSPDKLVLSEVTVYNDDMELYGVLDCIEFHKAKTGCPLPGRDGLYAVKIIEYKPTAPKAKEPRTEDMLQVYAQKTCVDSLFSCDAEAYIYYADIKKRVKLPFDTEGVRYAELLKNVLTGIQSYTESKEIPPAQYGQKCCGCSLTDICLPKEKKRGSLREQINAIETEGDESA